MAYAEVADVRARAGVLSVAFNQGLVAEPELDRFLDNAAGQLDAVIAALGFATPLTDPTAIAAIRSLNAAGALMQAIPAKWPDSNDGAKTLLESVAAEWGNGMKALADGSAVLVRYLESLASAVGPTDFWTENPNYGLPGDKFVDPLQTNPYLAPTVARTDRF